jgi:GTPase SAR1 family protein
VVVVVSVQVVVGGACGKSSMIAHLTSGKFVNASKPTTRTSLVRGVRALTVRAELLMGRC